MARRLLLVVVMTVVLAGCSGASTRAVAATDPSGQPRLPTVDTKATPPGWVPVDYGDGQVSVPIRWNISSDACPGPGLGTIFLHAPETAFCQDEPAGLTLVWFYPATASAPTARVPSVVNGIDTYPIDGFSALAGYTVPSLALQAEAEGPLAAEVLDTLTRSPRAVVLAQGSSPRVPESWRRVSFGGLSASVPKAWPVARTEWGSCTPTNLTLGRAGVYLVVGTTPVLSCSSTPAWNSVETPTDGILIDSGGSGPLSPSTTFARCFKVHDLSVCPTTSDPYGVLVAAVHVLRRSQPVGVEIGLAGKGMTARTILRSMRAG